MMVGTRGRDIVSLVGTLAVVVLVLVAGSGCSEELEHPAQMIVLGFDGMEPKLCAEMMADGRLPHLAKLAAEGSFKPLTTSTPPQSPVAWSNVITGTDSGQHGVFDFVHRDPKTGYPFSSAAISVEPEPLPVLGHGLDTLEVFDYAIPLRSSTLKTNRHAPAFWEYLTKAGVPTHIFRMPANYPPTPSEGAHFCCMSDMGTPDLVNSLGTFSYYTSDADEQFMSMSVGGGKHYPLRLINHKTLATQYTKFFGPANSFDLSQSQKKGGRTAPSEIPIVIMRDPDDAVVTVRYGDRDVVLKVGEWSGWEPVEFEMIPHVLSLKGICRMYLKEVHPDVKLYVTPFNFDPYETSWEIDQPEDFSATVADAVGGFYTQGLPEDTKALSNKVLSRDEFLSQAGIVFDERLRMLDFAMDHYQGGLLFFYFGQPDQIAHMFWGARNPNHPALTAAEHEKYKGVMEEVYQRMDGVVGKVRSRFPDAPLVVMSDHGFCEYRRDFHLNTWLEENGYVTMAKPEDRNADINFDYSRTRAYGIGINGLYINLKGREAKGIVGAGEKQALMDEISGKLKAWRDPDSGDQGVVEVYQSDRIFSGPQLEHGPDLLIGYASGYRGSGPSARGAFPKSVVEDNTDAWCADHCVATHLVPGVLFSSKVVGVDDPSLLDLAPTMLGEMGVAVPEHMMGRNLFERGVANAGR